MPSYGMGKRRMFEQHSGRAVRAKTSSDANLPELTNPCRHCLKQNIIAEFGKHHKCPSFQKKPLTAQNHHSSYKGFKHKFSGSSQNQHNGQYAQRMQRSAKRVVTKANKAASLASWATKTQKQRQAYSQAVIEKDEVLRAERQALQQSSPISARNVFYSIEPEEGLTSASESQLYDDDNEQGMQTEDEAMPDAEPPQCKKARMANQHNPHSNDEILIPIILQDQKVLALLDSGATFSSIDINFCKRMKWRVNKAEGEIHLADNNHIVKRRGVTDVLEVRYNKRSKMHVFEAMHLARGHVASIGTDLMPHFGIGYTGLVSTWDDTEQTPEKEE